MQPKTDFEQLKENYLNSSWFYLNTTEPRIGDPDFPALAEEHGPRGQSCYILYGYSDLSTNLGSHLLRDTNHT